MFSPEGEEVMTLWTVYSQLWKWKGMFFRGGIENRWSSWTGRDLEPLLDWFDLALYRFWRPQKLAEDGAQLQTWKAIRICAVFFKVPRKLLSGSCGCQKLSVDGCHNKMWQGWHCQIQSRQEKVKPREKDRPRAPLQKKSIQTTRNHQQKHPSHLPQHAEA